MNCLCQQRTHTLFPLHSLLCSLSLSLFGCVCAIVPWQRLSLSVCGCICFCECIRICYELFILASCGFACQQHLAVSDHTPCFSSTAMPLLPPPIYFPSYAIKQATNEKWRLLVLVCCVSVCLCLCVCV